jgi:hypothetical protein
LRSRPVEQATRGSKRVASQQILLKTRPQGFYSGLIKGREKAGQG